jgi:TIR domain
MVAPKDFFISYAGADRVWAEWIAWHLQANGYQPIVQAWDFRPGSNFVENMNRALEQSERTIAVLSPAYLKSAYGRDEWTAAFAHDQAGRPRLLVVRVEEVEPPALLRPLVYVDLVGLEAERAQEPCWPGCGRRRLARPSSRAFQAGPPVQPQASQDFRERCRRPGICLGRGTPPSPGAWSCSIGCAPP